MPFAFNPPRPRRSRCSSISRRSRLPWARPPSRACRLSRLHPRRASRPPAQPKPLHPQHQRLSRRRRLPCPRRRPCHHLRLSRRWSHPKRPPLRQHRRTRLRLPCPFRHLPQHRHSRRSNGPCPSRRPNRRSRRRLRQICRWCSGHRCCGRRRLLGLTGCKRRAGSRQRSHRRPRKQQPCRSRSHQRRSKTGFAPGSSG